ncbi:MAG: adenylosuccinate synthetase [Nitrososphaerales archaeon]
MVVKVIVGGFFGDEGKGKVIAYLALKDDVKAAVRGGVGPNAGHTVIYNGGKWVLRMLPSAVVNPKTKLFVGAGVLVDPKVFLNEVKEYKGNKRCFLDYNCSIIEEKHIIEDRGEHFKEKIGTTGTGTGPANSDRVLRRAKLAKDLKELKNYLADVSYEVNEIADKGESLIVEGTQGTFLSLYHGTYPYVTSKDVCASAICSDVGLGPKKVDEVIVVFKSFVTRVGSGPLEKELKAEEIERMGLKEFGAVTGRLRRVAPFNFDLAKRAVMLNSATYIALTKLDVLFPKARGIRDYYKLPLEAKSFVEEIEKRLNVPVKLIGTGPDVFDMIDRRD